ncbi:MAG: two-component sensor histidine kinase [Hyphomicrobiales bacterium]|nr:two-component sensor histidine kinase [Hyphomicrobiales bacterium]
MATIPDQTDKPLKFDQKARLFFKKIDLFGMSLLPKGLYARALIIIITPIVIMQSILVLVFMDRHWEFVTRRLSSATVQDVSMLISLYETYPFDDEYIRLTDMARQDLGLVIQILPGATLPEPKERPFFGFLDRTLSKTLRAKIDNPFWIDTVGASHFVDIRIKLDDAVMKVLARRSHTYASNTHIFLMWMGSTSLILLVVAILFLRNQIRPILALAHAAEAFGRGQPVPAEFRIRGAREVRQASAAFMEMRDRIERHVEQRTTMLAGVSHDLRTVLTRFRLQLAMLGDTAELRELVSDVDEMQQMLEDYLAFSKGAGGEEATHIDVFGLLSEIRDAYSDSSKYVVILNAPNQHFFATMRRNAFKRAITNLVSNATRFGKRILITAVPSRRNLVVSVEDDGPGIPPELREVAFRPFYSLDKSRNQNVKSTGLGLAITRDIIRAHGGEIHLGESRMGGLKATIRMPL